MNRDRLSAAYLKARDALLAERTPEGYWVGELSSSALSTATAVSALAVAKSAGLQSRGFEKLIDNGIRWLVEHQNADGGWGDTVKSFSNISTTLLCRAAFHLTGKTTQHTDTLKRCEAWLAERYGQTPAELAEAIRKRYGKDRTFAVPILTTCALAGLVPWHEVPRLPFELACLPQSWYRFARLPVVSYALPALIGIGQCVHHHRGTWNPLTGLLRRLGRQRSLQVLERIQPSSGGYLEATPLTSFIVMSLASFTHDGAAGRVIDKGVEFLVNSARSDGSWAIDSNLSVWVTTLSVNALAAAGDLEALDRHEELLNWLLAQQTKERHRYTGADPGGWGWSHLPGSVPDCDDTAGAVLALRNLGRQEEDSSVANGIHWVLRLRNRDGGWPTFCRGWGKLPFDRSGCDLTAHVLRTLGEIVYFVKAPFRYLVHEQRSDGSWLPLWFGNQHAPDEGNPTYGTAKVLAAFRDLSIWDGMKTLKEHDIPRRGVQFLLSIQNADGGWGGAKDTPSSVEETALAVEILPAWSSIEGVREAVERALEYLVKRVENSSFTDASPIGFYFAKLWYFEKLYPIIFTVAALGRALIVGSAVRTET
jgi:squalene-hopene/tetraprenyl-beta-curcumene cyclase